MSTLVIGTKESPRERRGAAALELSIVLPVLLLLCFAGIEYGRALSVQLVLDDAARVGADWAATHSFSNVTRASWEAQIRSEVTADMERMRGFEAGNLNISIQTGVTTDSVTQVTVSCSYDYEPLTSLSAVPSPLTLRSSLTVPQFR